MSVERWGVSVGGWGGEELRRARREGVERAVDLVATLLQDVQGLLGGIQLLMTQQVLNAPQILAVLQQMSRK